MQEIREGIQILANQPILRALAGSLGTTNFFGSFIGALYWLFLVRELDLPPALVGVSIGVGGVGALLGALIAGRLTQQFGQGRILLATMLLWGAFAFVIPLAYWRGPWLAPIVMATQLLGDIPIAIYLINEVSLRQSIIPDRLLGNGEFAFLGLSAGRHATGNRPVPAAVATGQIDERGIGPRLGRGLVAGPQEAHGPRRRSNPPFFQETSPAPFLFFVGHFLSSLLFRPGPAAPRIAARFPAAACFYTIPP